MPSELNLSRDGFPAASLPFRRFWNAGRFVYAGHLILFFRIVVLNWQSGRPIVWYGRTVMAHLRGESRSGSDDRMEIVPAIPCQFKLSQALLLALLLYSEGVILTCFLNTALKADFELKPTSSAMAMTV